MCCKCGFECQPVFMEEESFSCPWLAMHVDLLYLACSLTTLPTYIHIEFSQYQHYMWNDNIVYISTVFSMAMDISVHCSLTFVCLDVGIAFWLTTVAFSMATYHWIFPGKLQHNFRIYACLYNYCMFIICSYLHCLLIDNIAHVYLQCQSILYVKVTTSVFSVYRYTYMRLHSEKAVVKAVA